LWVGDRLVQPVDMHSIYPGEEQPYPPQMKRYLDPVLLWTVAATATSRVRLNASTLSTFSYEPPHLARMLTTLDVLSDGRLEVGVGLGWMKDEHDISRSADWRRRGRMLDGLLAFLHEWWTANPVSWDSEFFSLPPGRRGTHQFLDGRRAASGSTVNGSSSPKQSSLQAPAVRWRRTLRPEANTNVVPLSASASSSSPADP
jgi:alkanesulfonate monooxygenase SsuD/methylene tetrahydromethanopterin reductase-like flavin-dependent oxidoreductase (luciferase family)